MVLIITAYNTVFNTSGTPDGFTYILAIDWFMDRLRTTLNVTGDASVTGMVSYLTKNDEGVAEMDIQQGVAEKNIPQDTAPDKEDEA